MNRLALSLGFLGVFLTPASFQSAKEATSPEASRVEFVDLATSWPQTLVQKRDHQRETVAVWMPPTPSLAAQLPAATWLAGESVATTPDDTGAYVEPNWAVVARGATLRAAPSITAPTIDYYGVGTELNIISANKGWFEVSNPKTGQRGWIFGANYLDPIGKLGARKVVARPSPSPKTLALTQSMPARGAPDVQPSGLPQPYLLAPATPSEPVVPVRAKREAVSDLVGQALNQWARR
jgi:hypothetical protein